MPYAGIADVQARWVDPTMDLQDPGDVTRVQTLLDEAHDELSLVVPDVEARIAAGLTTPGRVARVIVAAVIRVLDNPRGYTSERAGETAVTYGGGQARDGQIRFPAADLVRLGIKPAPRGGTFALGLSPHRGGCA